VLSDGEWCVKDAGGKVEERRKKKEKREDAKTDSDEKIDGSIHEFF
jgi:hypothetical protein